MKRFDLKRMVEKQGVNISQQVLLLHFINQNIECRKQIKEANKNTIQLLKDLTKQGLKLKNENKHNTPKS